MTRLAALFSFRNYSFIIALLGFLTGRASAQLGTEWEWVNPTPHGMPLYDIEMLDESFAIVITGTGYIMRSWNAGAIWTNTSVSDEGFSDLCKTPSGTLFATLNSNDILKSTNRGDTWTESLNIGSSIPGYFYRSKNCIVFYDDQYGMASLANRDLYRTSDGGTSWEKVIVTSIPAIFSEIGVRTENDWFVVTRSPQRTYRTTDFGETWILDTSSFINAPVKKITFFDSTLGFACTEIGLKRTTDGGTTWELLPLSAGSIVDIRMGGLNGNTLFALGTGNATLSRSDDNGDTWSTVTSGMFENSEPMGCAFNTTRGGIIVGIAGFLAQTSHEGISWDVAHGLGYRGHIHDMDFPSPDYGIAAVWDHNVLISSDAGLTWTATPAVDSASFWRIDMISMDEGYAVGLTEWNSFFLYYTSDGGQTWQQRSYLLPFDASENNVVQQLAADGNHVYVAADNYRIFISDDEGWTFEEQQLHESTPVGTTSGLYLQTLPGGEIIYVGPKLFVSTDHGASWTEPNQSYYWSACNFLNRDEGYGITNQELIFTSDGGVTWSAPLLDKCRRVKFWNRNDGVVWRTEHNGNYKYHEVAVTNDGGATWTHRSMEEAPTWDNWLWVKPQLGFGYGRYGEIRRTTTSGVTPVQPTPILPVSLRLDASYPNPVSLSRHTGASMRLTLPAGAPQHITVSVYDMLGRKTEIAYSGFMDAGAHIISIPQSAFRLPGLYTVAVSAGEKRATKKVVVVE